MNTRPGNKYSFLVGGHFHGSSTNLSGFPAASLLANINRINADSSLALFSTGDLFLDIRSNIPNYKQALFTKLQIPLFNAVGNHDISGNIYSENFGKTWQLLLVQSEMFVILNTEINDGNIQGAQLEFLRECLEKNCYKGSSVKNIFIFSHRPIWAENGSSLENVFLENTKSDFGNNFQKEIKPLLNKYSNQVNIYWFSGSLGANAPSSFFYHRDNNKITFIQTAIRDLPRDGILKVKINNGIVSFETLSMNNEPVPKLEDCGLSMWKPGRPAQSFNYRLIPLYIKQMLFHRYFWYGTACTLVAFILLFVVRKRLKRKRLA